MTDPTAHFSIKHCRARQARLLEVMERLECDLVVVAHREHVQWLTGPHYGPLVTPLAALDSTGFCTLVAPNEPPAGAAVDRVLTYEAQWMSTLRNDQRQAAAEVLATDLTGPRATRWIGVEYSVFGPHLAGGFSAELIDIEPEIYRLRRYKHPDELACLRKAIGATGAMYARAREIVQPGVNELDVFGELQAAATRFLGEPPTAAGNDFACGVPGGPPRDRAAQDGELYILDLGPAYRGYNADNCRAIAVNRQPTDVQQAAWEQIAAVFPIVERRVKPGFRCRELYAEVKAHLDRHLPGSFTHHLGHGIGLFPHEAPHVNPSWDDTFELGEIFTIEPGLYSDRLRGGIRLEQDYLVTADGVELLSDFPLGLV